VETVPPALGARHAKLKLQPSTIARLMRWQYEAVEAGEPKPTYSDLVDALVVRSAHLRAVDVLATLQETG
jgi:hypothetical protein